MQRFASPENGLRSIVSQKRNHGWQNVGGVRMPLPRQYQSGNERSGMT
jgi:hypothetical protein